MQKEIITKKIFTDRIHSHISNNNWEDLIKLFPGAEEAKVSNTLLKSTALKIGEYTLSKGRYHQAIIFFNKSRIRELKNKRNFNSFVNAIDLFFNENVEEFSRADLAEFKQAVLPIIDFHKLKYPEHRQIVDSTEQMIRRIDYRMKYVAKDKAESKLTDRIHKIKDALYADMSPQEIRDEFAKLIEDDLRNLLEEKKSSKKKKKKSVKRGKIPPM